MPRYHFDVQDGSPSRDVEGTVLYDDEAARAAAIHFLGELLCERRAEFWATRTLQLTVSDGSGVAMFQLNVGVTSVAD